MTKVAWNLRAGLAAVAFGLGPGSMDAFGCPICYGATSAQTIEALKHGYIFLLFPPIVILGGIVHLAYQKRNECNKDARELPDSF